MPSSDPIHVPRSVSQEVQRRINALGIGQKMQDLPEELWHESFKRYMHMHGRGGGPNLRIIRLDPTKPSLTVTGFIFNKFVHPTENRFITPREAACLQGFPKDFKFSGILTSVQRQIGNAVPSQLACAVARKILNHIEEFHPFGLRSTIYKDGSLPAISMFSGAGGMDIGFRNAQCGSSHFQTRIALEVDHDCCETLRLNFPEMHIHEQSITDCEPAKLRDECSLEEGVLPLVFGGPPCQAFSQAGKQKATNDERGKLIFDYLRFIDKTKPVYFVLENVANLKGVAGGRIFAEVKRKVSQMGYKCSVDVLSADNFGAPQRRKRMIFIGVLGDYPPVGMPIPTHGLINQPFFSVGEALADLPSVEHKHRSQ